MEDGGQNQLFYMAYEALLFILCLGIIILFWKMTTGVTNDLLPEVWDNSTMSAKSYDSDYLGIRTEDNGGGTDTLYRTDGNIYVMSPEYKYNGIITGDQLVGEIMSIDAYDESLENIYVGKMDFGNELLRIDLKPGRAIGVANLTSDKYVDTYFFENDLDLFQTIGSTLSSSGSGHITGYDKTGPTMYDRANYTLRELLLEENIFVRYYEYDDNGNVRNIFYILQSSLADH